jgi:hypothetical protein
VGMVKTERERESQKGEQTEEVSSIYCLSP